MSSDFHCTVPRSALLGAYRRPQNRPGIGRRDPRRVDGLLVRGGPNFCALRAKVRCVPSASGPNLAIASIPFLVCSTDGGASFSAPIAASDHYGVDGVIVVADSIQNVYVFWHGLALNETAPANATSVTWLYQVYNTLHSYALSHPARITSSGPLYDQRCQL